MNGRPNSARTWNGWRRRGNPCLVRPRVDPVPGGRAPDRNAHRCIERYAWVRSSLAGVDLGPAPAATGGVGMLQRGTAKKVTIFVNEDTQHHFVSLCDSILTFLLHKGVSGATATRAMAGFGAHQVMHTTKIEVLTEHLPIRIEFIDSAEKVDELMPTLYGMVTDGIIEVQDTDRKSTR